MFKSLSSFFILSSLLFSLNSQALVWKAVFIAGDDSIENFDNGREDLTALFSSLGDLQSFQLSSSRQYVSKSTSESTSVYPATDKNISTAIASLKPVAGEACLIHMTSHGAKAKGFYLALSGILAPELFASWVNQACGQAPTVLLISACYSGQFITESLKGPNRVILTAARNDRPSFGCSADTEYTYWDACLLQEVPLASTWVEAYAGVQKCIAEKEAHLGAKPSEPQAYFGANTQSWKIME